MLVDLLTWTSQRGPECLYEVHCKLQQVDVYSMIMYLNYLCSIKCIKIIKCTCITAVYYNNYCYFGNCYYYYCAI